MYIDKNSPIPAYYQLRGIIIEKIKAGEFKPGELIPSERELGEKLSISRMTIRQALNQLASEGILYREKGKGTYVSRNKIEQRNIMSFSEMVRKRGFVPSTRVLEFKKVTDNQKVCDKLGLGKVEPLYVLKRLRLADGMPIAIEELFLPLKYCHDLESHNLEGSFYSLLKEHYGLSVSYIDNAIEAIKPSNEERTLLDIKTGIPLLKISGINYTGSGQRIFYERNLYRADEYSCNIRVFTDGAGR